MAWQEIVSFRLHIKIQTTNYQHKESILQNALKATEGHCFKIFWVNLSKLRYGQNTISATRKNVGC